MLGGRPGTEASAERLPQEAEIGISDDSVIGKGKYNYLGGKIISNSEKNWSILPVDNGVEDANMEENPAFSSEPLDSAFESSEGFLGTSGEVTGESAVG